MSLRQNFEILVVGGWWWWEGGRKRRECGRRRGPTWIPFQVGIQAKQREGTWLCHLKSYTLATIIPGTLLPSSLKLSSAQTHLFTLDSDLIFIARLHMPSP